MLARLRSIERAPAFLRDAATARVALRSAERFSIIRGGVPVKERRVREETRMGVACRERISEAKVCRFVVKAGREMFLAGFWSLWPNCCFVKEGLLVLRPFGEERTGVMGRGGRWTAYLDRHKHVVRRGVALDLFDHGGPIAAFAARYCCCSAMA